MHYFWLQLISEFINYFSRRAIAYYKRGPKAWPGFHKNAKWQVFIVGLGLKLMKIEFDIKQMVRLPRSECTNELKLLKNSYESLSKCGKSCRNWQIFFIKENIIHVAMPKY